MKRIPDHASPTLIEINRRYFATALIIDGPMPSELVRSALRSRKLCPIVGGASIQQLITNAFLDMKRAHSVAAYPCSETRQPLFASATDRTSANQLPPLRVDIGTEGSACITVLCGDNTTPFAYACSQQLASQLGEILANATRDRILRIRACAITQEREAVRIASSHWMSTFALISSAAARSGATA